MGTYSAPLTPSGQTQYNVTFFSARNLSPGDHVVLISNKDGTSPNIFWLDYFLIDTLPGSSPSAVSVVDPHSSIQVDSLSNSPPLITGLVSASIPNVGIPLPSAVPPQESIASIAIITQQITVPDSSIAASAPGSDAPIQRPSLSSSLPITTTSQASATATVKTHGTLAEPEPSLLTGTSLGSAVSAGVSSGGTATLLGPTATDALARNSPSRSPLRAAVVAGAVVAGLAAFVVLAVAFFYLVRRRRPSRLNAEVAPFITPSHGRLSPQVTSCTGSPRSKLAMQYSANYDNTTLLAHSGSPYATALLALDPDNVQDVDDSETQATASSTALLTLIHPSRSHSFPHTTSPSHAKPRAPDCTPSSNSTISTSVALPNISDASSTAHKPASRAFSRSASSVRALSPLMPPAAVIPPGEWHAPPSEHSRAHALLRNLFSRGHRAGSASNGGSVRPARDVDSGLRLYDDVVLPPPYTQD
ncbi:hypothetical protein C8Q77DRAFT_1092297 [Trametes polyzona]|nr:hypothetical protein C8Q77DRAFT_1092297 [Trametes polyzona]